MNNETQNFFDSKTVIAVILVAATFLGWQTYMQKKYPDMYANKTNVQNTKKTSATQKSNATSNATAAKETKTEVQPSVPEAAAQVAPSVEEKLVHFQSANLSFDISSKGMGLRNIKVLKYKDRKQQVVEIGPKSAATLPLSTSLLGRTDVLNFTIAQVNPTLFVGHAVVGKLHITKTVEIHPNDYSLEYKVSAAGNDPTFVGFTTTLVDRIQEGAAGGSFVNSLLNHSYDEQGFYIESSDSHDRVIFGKDDTQKSWSKVRIASIGSQYFTQAIVDKSPIMPESKGYLEHKTGLAEMRLDYPVLNRSGNFELSYTAYLGPKTIDLLSHVDAGLSKVVDLGFFGWMGRPLLRFLKWTYSIVGNWGVAIVLMTIVFRLLMLPFALYSYRSMRAMQVIQPQIKALREKYKDDQQKQQAEMMTLMKENKVNPVGGCLPMLLQVPIFFALDRVLENSIELYQAPFGFWIHDLSLKDPYYVLPVLMGIAMFFQTKISPNPTMDPSQAKLMLMMPIVFTVFMISLPSGLALYMLVSTVFGVGQQAYVMKQKTLSSGTT